MKKKIRKAEFKRKILNIFIYNNIECLKFYKNLSNIGTEFAFIIPNQRPGLKRGVEHKTN